MHILNDLCLEDLALLEDLLHGHPAHYDASFALDDALDNVLDMTAASYFVRSSIRGFPCQDLGILDQRVDVIVRADCENGGQGELQLLNGHGLQGNFEVKRTD